MNRLEPHVPQEHTNPEVTAACDPADAEVPQLELRRYHQERLARLFRRVSDSADGRYLMDVITRHRGIEPS